MGDTNVEATMEGHSERELPARTRLGMGGHNSRPRWETTLEGHNGMPQAAPGTREPQQAIRIRCPHQLRTVHGANWQRTHSTNAAQSANDHLPEYVRSTACA